MHGRQPGRQPARRPRRGGVGRCVFVVPVRVGDRLLGGVAVRGGGVVVVEAGGGGGGGEEG